jgi:hypothetical protein
LASLFADGRNAHSGRREQISPVQRAQIVEVTVHGLTGRRVKQQ